MRVKKVRGIKRKTKGMITRIEENTTDFPSEFYKGYWHMHLPVDQGFIDSDKAPNRVKRLCIQALIERTRHLMEVKPDSKEKFRVVAAIHFPHLWESQIIVFKGDRHFKEFFCREGDHQRWIPLSEERNLGTEWGLAVSSGMEIKGFKEEITDDECGKAGEVWFIGELT